MKIAEVAPLYESVPPKLYGGTERIVHFLTEELVRQGHEVTLFASGDSRTSARLVPCRREAIRLDKTCKDPIASHIYMLEKVRKTAGEFDVIHFHVDYLAFPFSRTIGTPSLSTLHGRLDIPEIMPTYKEFRDHPLVSISNSQREPMPWARWVGTIYHGLPRDLFEFREGKGGYLAFLGRISPEKRPDRAIEIAKRTGIPLKIAAKIDNADRDYYEAKIKKLMDHPLVEYIGEVNEREKQEFLGNALALLFPVDWPEPFGLVMIEAMACGTPVIAFRCGSVPEVMEHGRTGFIVDSREEAVDAVHKIKNFDRRLCREVFDRRFTVERMARDYSRVFARLMSKRLKVPAA